MNTPKPPDNRPTYASQKALDFLDKLKLNGVKNEGIIIIAFSNEFHVSKAYAKRVVEYWARK